MKMGCGNDLEAPTACMKLPLVDLVSQVWGLNEAEVMRLRTTAIFSTSGLPFDVETISYKFYVENIASQIF